MCLAAQECVNSGNREFQFGSEKLRLYMAVLATVFSKATRNLRFPKP